jgi:predicted nucleotidyltransferase
MYMNQQILTQIKELKRTLLPNDKLILFGSQARGDEREDSDWDLLVLLNKPDRSTDDYGEYGYPFAELGWQYGVYLSAKVYTMTDWERRKGSPFYKNVEHDGIEII